MSDPLPFPGSATSLARYIDETADHFEAAWQTGTLPRIEDYLAGWAEPQRSLLLQELIAREVACRQFLGEQPALDDYTNRFPGLDRAWLSDLLFSDPQRATTPATRPDTARARSLWLPAGTRLGRYRLDAVLGSGGFGVVYRGLDEELRREVAIKVPHRHRVATAKDVDVYLTEARVLAGLDHPGIVPLYDVGHTDDGRCFLVSKLIQGSDLAARLRQGRLPPREAAALTAAVAEALHYAHRHGLVHRDIKPGNILLERDGRPVVVDFGLALRDDDFSRSPTLAGTPAYMSPEQARGDGGRVDGRSDIFSLGVVFYELLTGRPPFRGGTVSEILQQVCTLEPRPIRQAADEVPPELEALCLTALAKDVAARYRTALDFAQDLRAWLAGPPPGSSDLRGELDRLRRELIAEGQRRRERPCEAVVGLRFLDIGDDFKDRVQELEQLKRWLADPAVRLVNIVGRGGMGKTSLACKLGADIEPEVRAGPAGQQGIVYVRCQGGTGPTVERLMHDFGRLLGSPHAEELAECWGDPCRALADRIGFLLGKLQTGRFLLVLDNFEDALTEDDTIGEAGLRTFVDLCLTMPHGLRVLVTSRRRVQIAGPGLKAMRVLALDQGLPVAESTELLRSLDADGQLGLRDAPADLLDAAARRCSGVPRALETLAGILAGDPTLTLAAVLDDQALFSERVVENLVAAHQRQLRDGERQVLEALAVYDQPVPAAAVRYLLQPFHPAVNVERCLRDLTRHHFVTHHRGRDTYELHPLDQQYAYAHLADDETRRGLHRRAAGFFAELRKPRDEWKSLADVQPQLAEFAHLVRAEEFDQACKLLQLIDFDYLARWGHSELVVSLRERLVGRLRDPVQAGMNYYLLGLAHNRLWSAEEAVRCFERLLETQRDFAPRPMYGDRAVSDVQGNLGRSLLLVGRVEEALRLFEETAAVMRRHGHHLGEGLWTGRRGEALEKLGRLAEAKSCHEFALERSRSAGDTRWDVTHLSNLAETHRLLGDPAAATRLLHEGLARAERTGNPQGQAFCLMRLGQLHHDAGQLAEARDHFERAVRIGLPPCNFLGAVKLGILSLASGQSRAHFAQTLALCRALLARTPRLFEALYALALAQLGDGQGAEALATYRQALAVCAAPGVRDAARRDVELVRREAGAVGGVEEAGRLLEGGVEG